MNKLLKLIKSMDYRELKSIQRDIYEGNMTYLIKKRLYKIEKDNKSLISVCPVCGNDIDMTNAKYVLHFGDKGFKKKAMFCEIDCLQFFISQLKENEIRRW